MDKATPTPASVDKQAALVAKLRYMGKQYAAGQVARGGAPQKHYLEEAADEIEMMAWALSVNEVTPESAQENAALRNVIQAACIDGLPGLARAWAKYFPDRPITIKGAEVERLAAQSAPTEQADLRQLMGMNEAEIDAELLAAGISPDDAVKRADRAIKGALATVRAERRAIEYGDIVHKQVVAMRAAVVAAKRWEAMAPTRDTANVPPGEWNSEPEGLTPKQAWWAGYRVGKGLPPDMPRSEAVAAQPSQAPVVQAVPVNCGTGYCSCIECVVEPDRASSGATTQAVRMLTKEELHMAWVSAGQSHTPARIADAVQREFCAVNAGKRIPASGEIGEQS